MRGKLLRSESRLWDELWRLPGACCFLPGRIPTLLRHAPSCCTPGARGEADWSGGTPFLYQQLVPVQARDIKVVSEASAELCRGQSTSRAFSLLLRVSHGQRAWRCPPNVVMSVPWMWSCRHDSWTCRSHLATNLRTAAQRNGKNPGP